MPGASKTFSGAVGICRFAILEFGARSGRFQVVLKSSFLAIGGSALNARIL